jgi:hypothetical protein
MLHWIPLIVTILGFVAYVICSKAEPKELGRLAFAIGLLVVLLHLDSLPLR